MPNQSNTINLNFFSHPDTLTRFRMAASYLQEHPGTTLVIPPGKYILHDSEAAALQQKVMNGELGNNVEPVMYSRKMHYVSGLSFVNCRQNKIIGDQALLLFDGFLEPLTLHCCTDFSIQGITVDYLRKPFSHGIIQDISPTSATVRFQDEKLLSEKMAVLRILTGSKGNIREVLPDLRQSPPRMEKISSDTIIFHSLSLQNSRPGDEFYLWHTFHFRPAIMLHQCRNIQLENCTIHAQPGMGILGHLSENIRLTGCAVIPSPGLLVSTNTDAAHFASCSGKLLVEDCSFAGHGDDALNVHNYYHRILSSSRNSCLCEMDLVFGTHSQKTEHFSPGDILELTAPDSLAPLEQFRVTAAEPQGFCRTKLELDKALPDHAEGKYLTAVNRLPELIVTDCHIGQHLSRGILIKARHALVEHCLIEDCTGTAIQIAAEAFWCEGTPTEQTIIRNNHIRNCGTGVGCIEHTGGITANISAPVQMPGIHNSITIQNNIIDCAATTPHAVLLSSVRNAVLENNTMTSQEIPLITDRV